MLTFSFFRFASTFAAGGGLLITNGEFTSFRTCSAGCSACGGGFVDPTLGDDGSEPMQIKVRANNTGAVKFVDCGFWGPTHKIAELDGQGTTTFDACSFLQWGGARMQPNISAMTQRGGNLVLTSNEFMQPTRHLDILGGARKTLVTGNIFAGALDINSTVGPAITNATCMGFDMILVHVPRSSQPCTGPHAVRGLPFLVSMCTEC